MTTVSARARGWFPVSPLRPGLLETAATLGAVAAGAAIFEAALVPGLLIGGAAVLAPRLIPRDMFGGGLDRSRRARRAPAFSTGVEHVPAARKAEEPQVFDTGRAVVKTFTYRVIVTAVDFGANYFVIGELATAAGLSTLSLVAGPIFYFAHEAAWHYYGPASARAADPLEAEALVPIPGAPAGEHEASASFAGVRVSRALGKTITYEGVTAVSEFVANYIFVRDIATAAGMTAFSVVISPFVYYAHEKAWDYYDATKARASAAATEGA